MRGNVVIAATEKSQLKPMTTKIYGMASLESLGSCRSVFFIVVAQTFDRPGAR
jgi:hypothetical protein